MNKKVSIAAACLALAALPAASLAGGGSSAGSGTKTTTLTIKTGNSPGQFKGRVKSDAAKCTKNRLVKVLMRVPGPNPIIGSDSSNSEGRWTANTASFSGTWYAKVSKVVKGGTTCGADRSKAVSAG